MNIVTALLFNAPPPVLPGITRTHLMDAKVAKPREPKKRAIDRMNEQYKLLIFGAIANGDTTVAEIQDTTRLAKSTVQRYCQRLLKDGDIIKHNGLAGRHYYQVAYHARR